jgi:glucose/mannose transport system substrate-binding protein
MSKEDAMTSRGLCLLALTASFLGSTACSSDSGTTEKAGDIEVFSWWTAGGEKEAFDAVVAINTAKYPKVTVTNAALALGTEARTTLQTRMQADDPPDLFQANIGADLLQWAGTQPKIENLNEIADAEGWRTGATAFYPDILQEGNLSEGGNLYAVPANIHRINSLFVNLPILARNNITVESLNTLDGLHTALATLALDTDANFLAPLTIGSKFQWTLDIMILQGILPAVAGGTAYENYFRGGSTAADPIITAMLDETATLWQYMPTGADSPNSVDWVPAIQYFIDGRVAMTVMGDWAKGLIDASGTMVAGVDYDEIPFPGTAADSAPFIYTTDTFALPSGAAHRDLAIDFMKTFASDEGQFAFNDAKGSIPARRLGNEDLFDVVTNKTIAAYNASTDRHVALSGITPSGFSISQALFDFVATCEAGACNQTLVTTALTDSYPLLQQ